VRAGVCATTVTATVTAAIRPNNICRIRTP
jgi:hypothetical protein